MEFRPKWSQLLVTVIVLVDFNVAEFADKPCAARAVYNRSVVCVCTAEYCDTVVRETPGAGEYYTYVSSEAGLRFYKTRKELQPYSDCSSYNATLELDPATIYQTINGFGGSVTDAVGINWKSLTDPQLRQNLIESYFGKTGLEYNMMRVPIGGSDYSTHAYAYNEYPENDTALSNYTLAYEDFEYKIPMIKAAMEVATASIDIVASTWSPPPWMKDNKKYSGKSSLLKEYYQTYADYHLRFIQEYNKVGIPIWGITTTNEPFNAVFAGKQLKVNDLGWSVEDMAEWIQYYLGPTIRNSTYKGVKIMAGDDQRYEIPLLWNMMVIYFPGVLEFIDGIAVHFYYDTIIPPTILTQPLENYPNLFVLSTEAAQGIITNIGAHIDLGSWARAEGYFTDIIEDLNYNVIGWIDWNLCLNTTGGPSFPEMDAAADSAVIVDAEAGEFLKQPMFYAVGHFSKFVPRGSRRIKVSEASCQSSIQNVAVITPQNTIVVELYNEGASRTIRIRLGDKEAVVALEEKSFTTVEFNNE